MSLRTPLGKVRGLGSAKRGSDHFWHQRLSAVLLLPLTLWFVWAVARYAGAPHADVVLFLQNPFNASAMLLFVLVGLYHMVLGVQVVIEDYVRAEGAKIAALLALKFGALAVGALCTVSVFRILTAS